MAYVIAEPCIDVLDISCVSVCPVDCIHYEEGVDRKLFIDPNECIDCGACEPECPVNAIFPEESLPPEWANYTPIDAMWFTDRRGPRDESTRSSPPDRRRARSRGAVRPALPVRPDRCASPRSCHRPRRSSAPSGWATSWSASPTSATGRQKSRQPVLTRSVHDLSAASSGDIHRLVADSIHGGSSLYALDEEALAAAAARPDPDPGAVPGLRGELSRGQRGRPDDRRGHHRRLARADLASRGSSTPSRRSAR